MGEVTQLIDCIGAQTPEMEKIREAVAWLVEKPEVQSMLEKAIRARHAPLTVRLNLEQKEGGVYLYGPHFVDINPHRSNRFKDTGGQKVVTSLERTLAHEFAHAPQKLLVRFDGVPEQIDWIAHQHQLSVPEHYEHRIRSAKTQKQLEKVFGEIYDRELAPAAPARTETYRQALRATPRIKEYVDKIEAPAIKFENLIMGKYKGETLRHPDYIESLDLLGTRDAYIDEAVKTHLTHQKFLETYSARKR